MDPKQLLFKMILYDYTNCNVDKYKIKVKTCHWFFSIFPLHQEWTQDYRGHFFQAWGFYRFGIASFRTKVELFCARKSRALEGCLRALPLFSLLAHYITCISGSGVRSAGLTARATPCNRLWSPRAARGVCQILHSAFLFTLTSRISASISIARLLVWGIIFYRWLIKAIWRLVWVLSTLPPFYTIYSPTIIAFS